MLQDFVDEDEDHRYVSETVSAPVIETPLLSFLDLPSASTSTSQGRVEANKENSCQDEGKDFLSDMSDESLSLLEKYPTVKKMYRRYNVTLPSSASVERLFSYSGMVFTKKRSRLSDEHLEELVLLKANKA
jgi:hypothetical protein